MKTIVNDVLDVKSVNDVLNVVTYLNQFEQMLMELTRYMGWTGMLNS